MRSNNNESIFDAIAETYDNEFSNTITGRHQRKQVHQLLEKNLTNVPINILEINCGTGIDAIKMAGFGHAVTASDESSKMISIANQKNNFSDSINFVRASFSELKTTFEGKEFDLIFSNFGGLNCVNPSELKKIFNELHQILKPNGKLIIVIMSDAYIWDWIYFTLKGEFKNAMRRKKVAMIPLKGNIQETWYYNINKISAIAADNFKVIATKPIGQLIPPTHLEKKLKFMFAGLAWLERISQHILPSDISDHTYIELERIQ
jgi:ubiquinone/menaquinone biosynthesis C-methylase UbiE